MYTYLQEGDPMDNDVKDCELWLDRRTLWIGENKGESVFARATGNPKDELILLVHGSGPKNSSAWWCDLSYRLALLATAEHIPRLKSFYQVCVLSHVEKCRH